MTPGKKWPAAGKVLATVAVAGLCAWIYYLYQFAMPGREARRLVSRSNELFAAHDYAGATVDARMAVRLDPNSPDARNCLARILYVSGDKEGARREWLKCIDLGNSDVADQARAYMKKYNL